MFTKWIKEQFLIKQRNEQQKGHCFVNHVSSSRAKSVTLVLLEVYSTSSLSRVISLLTYRPTAS